MSASPTGRKRASGRRIEALPLAPRRAESDVLSFLFVIVLTFLILGGILWGTTQFGHSFLYEEPPTQMLWRTPAAAGAVVLFLLVWSLGNYAASTVGQSETPYDSVFAMSTDKTEPPVAEFWATKGEAPPVRYRLRKSGGVRSTAEYYDDNSVKFREADTIVLHKGKEGETRYKLDTAKAGAMDVGKRWLEEGGKRVLGEDGTVTTPRAGRSAATLIVNALHFGVWFAVLWLLLRFHWPHALGLAVVAWVAMTFALPLLFAQLPVKKPTAPVTTSRPLGATALASAP